MQTFRSTSRRSFLSRVAGGGLIVGAGLIYGAGSGPAQPAPSRQMVVDADPRDPARAPAPPRPDPPSRPVDADSGPTSDTTGRGKPARGRAQSERFVVCPGNLRCPS